MPKITKFVKPTGETITFIPFQWGLDDEEVIQFHLFPEPIQVILQARLEFAYAFGWYCEDNEHLFDLLDNKFTDRGCQLYQQHKHTIVQEDKRNRWINLQKFLTSTWAKGLPR